MHWEIRKTIILSKKEMDWYDCEEDIIYQAKQKLSNSEKSDILSVCVKHFKHSYHISFIIGN